MANLCYVAQGAMTKGRAGSLSGFKIFLNHSSVLKSASHEPSRSAGGEVWPGCLCIEGIVS